MTTEPGHPSFEVAATLDVAGLGCPLPVLKARKALGALAPGAILEVFATDPGAAEDFASFCGLTGHKLVSQSARSGIFRFLIQKAVSTSA